ncbi:MAG TPA: hypothetical protein VK982_04730 [Bacteroidales bacterium]|nr:hypothetical protein [Bacteroidales bacterium]
MGNNDIIIVTNHKEVLKYFCLYSLINALLLYYIHDLIITDPQYFTGGNMKSVSLFRTVWRVIYFLSPVYEFVKILIISFLLYKSIQIFTNVDKSFWGIFYIVLLAQIVLLIPDLLEVIWFSFFKTDYSMIDVDYFNPLSITNFFHPERFSDICYKFLSSINIFNIVYWGILIFFIKKIANITLKKSFKVVVSFYGSISIVISLIHFWWLYKLS